MGFVKAGQPQPLSYLSVEGKERLAGDDIIHIDALFKLVPELAL